MSEQAAYTEHVYQEYHYKDFEPIHQREEIVRCRDCVYFDKYENDEISVCYRFDNEQPIVEPDGFCAWGERKERIER